MRLQLDTSVSSTSESAQAAAARSRSQISSSQTDDASHSGDSISVSNSSSAINAFSSERASRIAQLAATVQRGQYQVSSAALSSAIVGQAVSPKV
jgi:anti-sigma28 factor (negative regulator of flagellin synthesis)